MSVHATPIHHSAGSSSQCNKARKGNKRCTDSKEETVNIADDMIFYLENPLVTLKKKNTKNLLKLNEFHKIVGYKTIKKNQLWKFPCSGNESD